MRHAVGRDLIQNRKLILKLTISQASFDPVETLGVLYLNVCVSLWAERVEFGHICCLCERFLCSLECGLPRYLGIDDFPYSNIMPTSVVVTFKITTNLPRDEGRGRRRGFLKCIERRPLPSKRASTPRWSDRSQK